MSERNVIAEVGGEPDETAIALCGYGEGSALDQISRVLDVRPMSRSSKAWVYEARVKEPTLFSDAVDELLAVIDVERVNWGQMPGVNWQIRIAMHSDRWNFGLSIREDQARALARIPASWEFDIYAYSNDT